MFTCGGRPSTLDRPMASGASISPAFRGESKWSATLDECLGMDSFLLRRTGAKKSKFCDIPYRVSNGRTVRSRRPTGMFLFLLGVETVQPPSSGISGFHRDSCSRKAAAVWFFPCWSSDCSRAAAAGAKPGASSIMYRHCASARSGRPISL